MRRNHAVAALALLVSACAARGAAAQVVGYGVAGPAGVSGFFGSSASMIHAAGGGEVLAGGLVGFAGEFGVLANSGSLLFVGSANGVVHFSARQLSPFVTAGYTHMIGAQCRVSSPP